MSVGPYAGNGFEWDRGPFHCGIWVEPDAGGFGEALVIGHRTPNGWDIDGDCFMDEPDAWQSIINTQEPDPAHGPNGLIGAWYVLLELPHINAMIEYFFPLNPLVGKEIKNTDPYSRDLMNALIAQFTEVNAQGHLKQKGT